MTETYTGSGGLGPQSTTVNQEQRDRAVRNSERFLQSVEAMRVFVHEHRSRPFWRRLLQRLRAI